MIVGQLEIQMLANMARLQADMDIAKRIVGGAMEHIDKMVDKAKKSLLGLGAGLSVAGFVHWMRGAIDAGDETAKLAQKIGVTTKEVAGMQLAFRQAGVGDAFATSMAKMSKAAAEGSKAFEAMGISTRESDGTLRSTRVLLGEVADKFSGYADGAAKSALAQEIFGKSGAELIPLLNAGAQGLAEYDAMAQKLGLTIGEETAKQAEKFNDTLDLIGQGSQGVARQVAAQLLPTLSGLADQFFTSMSAGDKLKNTADFLASSMKVLYIAGISIVEVFSTVGKTLGAAGAQLVALVNLDFAGASAIGKEWAADVGSGWKDTLKQIEGAWNATGSASVEAMAATQKGLKGAAPLLADLEKNSKAASAEQKKQAELMAEMSGLSKSFQEDWARLSAAYKKGTISSLADLTAMQATLLSKQPAMKAMHDAELKAVKEITDARQAARVKEDDGIQKYLEAQQEGYNRSVKGSNDALKAAREQYDQYGLSKAQIAEVTLLTLQADQAKVREGSDGYEAIQKQIDNQKKLIVVLRNTEALDAQKSMWSSIESTARSTFVNIFQGGQDAFTKLRDVLKATLLDFLYQMTVKKWIFNIAASVSGAGVAQSAIAGMTGGSGGGGGSMGLLDSVLGNAGGFFGAGGVLSEGISGIGASLINGPLSSVLGDFGATLVSSSSTIAAAVPYIGAAMAGFALLKNVMDYKIDATGNALTATVGSKGVLNGTVGTRADFTQTGGFMGGGVTKNSTWGVADAGTTGYINAVVQNVTASNAAYARILGLNVSALDGYTKALDINITGMDAAAAQTAINTEVQKFGVEQVTAAYGEALAQYAKAGETVSDTLKRLAGIEVASAALNEFGGVFSRIATLGIEGRDSMFALAGGIEAFVKKSADFVKLYYSADEQSGIRANAVLAQLNAAGVTDAAQLSNKEEFRALVESVDVTTQTGREQLNALLTIAPQFAQVSEYLKANNIDLGDLAAMAPAIAALDPLFQQNNDAATANATAATDATTASINATTDAINDNTTAVVAAVNNVATAVAAAVRDGMAAANASSAKVGAALDSIDSRGRLELAGG